MFVCCSNKTEFQIESYEKALRICRMKPNYSELCTPNYKNAQNTIDGYNRKNNLYPIWDKLLYATFLL